MKSLPRETFEDATPLDLIAHGDYERLNLYGVQNSMLEDARRRFATGVPDRHGEASREYKKPVYEVRDRSGAGWRGAVVLDEDGDPWLVWVERHDQFHRGIASVARKSFVGMQPGALDYKLRQREESATGALDWKRYVLTSFVEALRESVETGASTTVTIGGARTGETATLDVATAHDEPSGGVSAAHDDFSMLIVDLRVKTTRGYGDFHKALLNVCLPFLQPDPSKVETAYGKDNSLTVYTEMTHAQLIQLLADPPPYDEAEPFEAHVPDRLHYVGVGYLVDGYVDGKPVRGVCGEWFIASRDEFSGLPVCERCEAERPAAQMVLDLLRAHGQ